MRPSIFAACFMTAFMAAIGAARADDPARPADPAGSGEWIVTIGGNPNVSPRFAGAQIYGLGGLPQISFRRRDEPDQFSAPEDGLDYTLLGDRGLSAGIVANVREGRHASLDRRLAGLRSFPVGVDAGVFVQAWVVPETLRARVEIRQGLRNGDGTVADLFVDGVRRIGAFTFSLGPRLTLADVPANRLEFGVSDYHSSLNGAPSFHPSAGLRSVGLGAAVSYDWSPEWRTTLYYKFDRLVSAAAASPITTRYGDENQMTLGLGIFYSFRTDVFD